MKGDVILKTKDLSIEIDGFLILDKINLDIYEGEMLGIIGMSGAGKTTLLSSLIGVFPPLSGDVYFSHRTPDKKKVFKSVNALKQYFRQRVGFSSQIASFYDKLTVVENLQFFASFYGLDKYTSEERIKILLDLFDLYLLKDKLAEALSGGMRKRLDMACAMINNPKILLLDEPTANLDPVLKKQMWALIQKINEKGTTVIIASHLVSDLEQYCDRLVILSEGKFVREGTPRELRGSISVGSKILLETSPGDYPKLAKLLKKKKVVTKALSKGDHLILYAPNGEKALNELMSAAHKLKERVISVEMNKPSLDDFFATIVEQNEQ
jgi:ABC-2 type transport system ATP-binding protein